MKKIISKWMLVVLLFGVASTVYGCCEDNEIKVLSLHEKFYVDSSKISFLDNRIYIDAEGIVYQTPAIHADENGFYIERVAKSGSCSWVEWQCRRCGFCNLRGLEFKCRSCNFPISV